MFQMWYNKFRKGAAMAKKKRRRVKSHQVVAQNALSGQHKQKKRFGKKQKKKLILIFLGIFVVALIAGYFVNQAKIEKEKLKEKMKQGDIVIKNAEKQKLDDEGNPVDTHHDTSIIVLSAGNGNATLIKKDNFEVLIDAGAEDVSDKIGSYVKGNLEYLVITGNMEECTAGVKNVCDNYKIDSVIYPEGQEKALKEIKNKAQLDEQIIDMGENLSVSIRKPVGGKSEKDNIAIVTVNDNDETVQIVGQASAKNIKTLLSDYSTSTEAYIIGGRPSTEDHPLTTLDALSIYNVICSCAEPPDEEFISHLDRLNIRDCYNTAENGTITLTIGKDNPTITVEKDPKAEEQQ